MVVLHVLIPRPDQPHELPDEGALQKPFGSSEFLGKFLLQAWSIGWRSNPYTERIGYENEDADGGGGAYSLDVVHAADSPALLLGPEQLQAQRDALGIAKLDFRYEINQGCR